METKILSSMDFEKITQKFSLRDKAFLTCLKQSGLRPSTIAQLKIRNVEKILTDKTPIPCRIVVPQGIEKNKVGRHVSFISEETVQYLKKYIEQRKLNKEKPSSESLLFITRKKPNQQILTKEVNRDLKDTSQKILGRKIELEDLRQFFLEKTTEIPRNHINYMIGEPTRNYRPKNDNFYRNLYEKFLMDALSSEPNAATNRIRMETQDFKERLEKIESVLFPKTRQIKDVDAEIKKIEKYIQKYPERAEQEERWYNQQVAEAEKIELLMKKNSWHWACLIQQMNTKIKAIEYYIKNQDDKTQ